VKGAVVGLSLGRPPHLDVKEICVAVYQSGGPRPCRWCSARVVDDGRGNWVHESGRDRCRNDAGVPTEHYATPVLAARPMWGDGDG